MSDRSIDRIAKGGLTINVIAEVPILNGRIWTSSRNAFVAVRRFGNDCRVEMDSG